MKQIEAETRVRVERLKRAENAWYEVTLTEARRDPLREKLQLLGHPVEKMKRIKLANIEIGDLAPGRFRKLTPEEIAGLEKLIAKQAVRTRDAPKPAPRSSGVATPASRFRDIKRRVSHQRDLKQPAADVNSAKKSVRRPPSEHAPNEHRPKGNRNE
jgi:hypothetical protein